MEKTAATLPINENYQKEINIYQEERLTIFSINVRSIRNKETELFTFIEEMNFPDVICITEHWLSPFEKICIDKYQTVSLYTRDTLKHGGTAILVRKDITCNHITKFDYLITKKISKFVVFILQRKISTSLQYIEHPLEILMFSALT